MTAPLLEARRISKAFDQNAVLHGVDLTVSAGEVVALLGENGAGKSTLVNIISGGLQSDSGEVVWNGDVKRFRTAAEGIAAGIIHIHQELSIITSLSVMENLFIGDYHAGRFGIINRKRLAEEARVLLGRMGVSHIDPYMEAGRLSVAEQQMVEIAKALARDAKLLILDEPTAALTPHESEALFRVVRQMKERGVGIVFISHRLDEVFGIADRVVVLRDGRVISGAPVGETSVTNVIADMTGRTFQGFERTSPALGDEPILVVEDLSDGGMVGPVSFALRRGEILGIFGLVGSGRTELLEMIVGARRISTGSIARTGGDAPRDPGSAWRSGIAFLPEGRKINGILPDLAVAENTIVAVRQDGPFVLSVPGERDVTGNLRDKLGIVVMDMRDPVRRLSGGNQQKVLLARCLAANPAILLLDEPTHGVDVRTKADLYRAIQSLAAQGTSVVFVSSELPEVLALATTVLVLANGEATLYKPNDDLPERDVLAAAFMQRPGLSAI
jgi:ribose transport system ATP-binding protein